MSEPTGKRSTKQLLLNGMKLAVVVGALSYLIFSGKLRLHDLRFAPDRLHFMAVGAGLYVIGSLLSFVRYRVLLAGLRVSMGLRDVTRIGFIGCFFNTFMPGGLGGDVIKLAYVMRETGRRAEAVASVMVDRVLGLLGMFTVGGVALCFSWERVVETPKLHALSLAIFGVLGAAGFTTLISLIALAKGRRWAAVLWAVVSGVGALLAYVVLQDNVVAFSGSGESTPALLRGRALLVMGGACLLGLGCVLLVPSCQPGRRLARFISARVPLGGKLMQLAQAVLAYKERFSAIGIGYALSVLLQGLVLLSLYAYSQSLALAELPRLSEILYAGPPALVANVMPISFGGLGVGEAAFRELLLLASAGRVEGGAAIFLLFRFWFVMVGLIGLPIYVRGKKEIQAAQEAYERAEVEGLAQEDDADPQS